MACVLAAGVHGPGYAVQWETLGRCHAVRPHAGTAEMDSVFSPRSSVDGAVRQSPCKQQVGRSNRDRGRQGICHVRLVAQDTRFSFL